MKPSYENNFCVVAHSEGPPVIHLCAKQHQDVFFSGDSWSILHCSEEWYDGQGNFSSKAAEKLWNYVIDYVLHFRGNHGADMPYPDTVIVYCPRDPNIVNAMRMRWKHLSETTGAYFRVSFSVG